MSKEKAKKHFLGRDGHERLDCAQAIIRVFSGLDQDEQNELCKGGGMAPGGECGAYCAAKHLLEKKHPEKLQEFEIFFTGLAGSLKCNEIRSLRKLSCLGCVEKAAEFLESSG